jgi:hypothetical protein
MAMKPEIIAQLIVQRGLSNVNLTMFTETEKKAILSNVAEIYMRQGKTDEVMGILEFIDEQRFNEMLKKMAEQCFELSEYDKASKIYEKLGDKEFSQYIKDNFLTKN